MAPHDELLSRAEQVYGWLREHSQRGPNAQGSLGLALLTLRTEWWKLLPLEREEIFDHLLDAYCTLCGGGSSDMTKISSAAILARLDAHPARIHRPQLSIYNTIVATARLIAYKYDAAYHESLTTDNERAAASAWHTMFISTSGLSTNKVVRMTEGALRSLEHALEVCDQVLQGCLSSRTTLPLAHIFLPTVDVAVARAQFEGEPAVTRFTTFYRLTVSFTALYRAESVQEGAIMVQLAEDLMHDERASAPFTRLTLEHQEHVVTHARNLLYETCLGYSMHGMLPDAAQTRPDARLASLAHLSPLPHITDRKRRYYRTTAGARGGAF